MIKHLAAEPQRELSMLYRQVIFNVMIGNTDDHLKNFSMLHDENGWRLSPAFDLVPNIGYNREHVLRIGLDNRVTNPETLLAEAKYFGIKRRRVAEEIVAMVMEAVAQWASVFHEFAIPGEDVELIGADIESRLKICQLSWK